MNDKLIGLVFSERYLADAAKHPDLFLGRIIGQSKDLYMVATEKSRLSCEISGKLRYAAGDPSDFPAVGDYVLIDRADEQAGHGIIHYRLPRKSVFIRKAAGTAHTVQVVAANIDTVFICMSLNNDYNLRRLERYLAIAWDSGAAPVIVLTKSDLCEDLPEKLLEIEQIAPGVDLLVTSSLVEDGFRPVLKYIRPGRTVAFIGSSGVGKSTLINRLLGEDAIATKEVRNDDKGRHTTTTRELIAIPSGGAVIDTPGMRELGVESIDLAKTFADIDELARQCRFNDCQHENEPDCAVRLAIADGRVSQERLQSYKKLKKEAKYDGLNSKQIEKEKTNEMFANLGGLKNARDYRKSKKRGR